MLLSIFWNLAVFIGTLIVLITVHEFGHFWVARRCGIRVECFSIGFGKALWRRLNRDGVEFVIALVPIGGYIKMLDERVQSVSPEMRPYAFNNKTIRQRAATIVAGPVANFILAIFSYWLVFIIGIPGVRPVVGEIIPHSIAETAKIVPNMELKKIDGVKTPDWDTVRFQLASNIGNEYTRIIVANFGSKRQQEKILNLRHLTFNSSREDLILALGIRPLYPKIEPILGRIQVNSGASKAGLKVGDKILRVNDQPVTQWMMFVNLVRDNPNRPLKLDIERQGSILTLTLIPNSKSCNKSMEGIAGVSPKIIPLADKYKIIRKYNIFDAMLIATEQTWQLIKIAIQMLKQLIIGNVKLNNVSGPISIAQEVGISAKFGVVRYLMLLALISVNLGIINLFPLPILDGGCLLFLVIEALKGSPVSNQVQDISYRISAIFLMLLMWLAFFNDLSRL